MSEMVERVEEALAKAFADCGSSRSYEPSALRCYARAAIVAMRPTPAEMEAARSAVKARALWDPASDVSTSADVALSTFFDAALKP